MSVSFPVSRYIENEWVYHRPYRVVYDGDQVVAMDPKGPCSPMYPDSAELAELEGDVV